MGTEDTPPNNKKSEEALQRDGMPGGDHQRPAN